MVWEIIQDTKNVFSTDLIEWVSSCVKKGNKNDIWKFFFKDPKPTMQGNQKYTSIKKNYVVYEKMSKQYKWN